MELNDKFDKAYNRDKQLYINVSKLDGQIKTLKQDLKKLVREGENALIKKKRAQEDKDKAEEKKADNDIKDIKEKINNIKQKIEKMERSIRQNKEKVDSYINSLNKEPEFQAQVNSILEKKYNRAIKKSIDEKEKIDLIINICEEHPSLEMNLRGMIRAVENNASIEEKMEKFDEELKTLDPIKDKARIDQIKNVEMPSLASDKTKNDAKSSMNEKTFMDFCKKNNLNVDVEFLKKLIKEKSFAHDKGTGEIQSLKSLKKMSKGYDKRIKNYEKCIEKIPGAQINTPKKETKSKQPNAKSTGKEDKEEINLPDKKYKWYEFRKRFSAWREKKRVQRETEKEEKQGTENGKETNKFKDAYKYTVVQDYINNKMKDIYKEAAKEPKSKDEEELLEDDENEL